jgi:hypothetical protein
MGKEERLLEDYNMLRNFSGSAEKSWKLSGMRIMG